MPLKKSGSPKEMCCAPCGDLAADIFHHHVARDDAENSVVDRNNGAMPTEMFAAAAGFGGTDDAEAIAGDDQVGVFG